MPSTSQADERRWCTRTEIADELGVSEDELSSMVHRGELEVREEENGRRVYRRASSDPRAEGDDTGRTENSMSLRATADTLESQMGDLLDRLSRCVSGTSSGPLTARLEAARRELGRLSDQLAAYHDGDTRSLSIPPDEGQTG